MRVGSSDIDFQVCLFGDDVFRVTCVNGTHGYNSEIWKVDFAGWDSLQAHDGTGGKHNGIYASVWLRSVAAAAFDC